MRKIKLFLSLLMLMIVSVGNVWAATTYKLTQVTSVSAGNKYVFVQSGHAMNNTCSSSALQTTTSYNTTGLAGTETYVWTLETATGGFYLKNVSLNSNQYLNNSSSTGVSFGTKNSIWSFNFQTGGNVEIQNNSNSNRFLGFTNSTSYAYKAYATSNMSGTTYPHVIYAYVLEEETTASPSVSVSPTSLTFDSKEQGATAPGAKTFTITGSNLTGNLSMSASTSSDYYTWTVTSGSLTKNGSNAVSATVTVTPKSSITDEAGSKAGTITISGGGASSQTVSLSMTVTAPAHIYQYTHDFTAISGFSGWSQGSYSARTLPYDIIGNDGVNDDQVYMADVCRQGSTITNMPVTKGSDVELKLLNNTKYITAVKLVCEQWGTKAQTITLNYSTDGGTTYSTLSPSVTSNNFTIESLSLPAKTNAVKFTFSSASNQVGISSVHFDLVDKVTYSIGKDETGCTLSVTDGTSAITTAESGDEVYVSIATTEEGYENASFVVKDADNNTVAFANGKFTMPAKNVTITATATKKTYTVTLSAANGKIQVGGVDKESITVAHGETAELTAVPNTDYAFNGWTSNSANVVLTDAAVNPATITVTGAGTITANFISTAKLNPGFAWSDASAEAVKGQAASLPTLTTNPYSLTPTYVSTNTDVAEINNAGEVTIKAVGSTTIKATYAEDPTYADCEATYTLTVKGRVTWHIIKEGVEETSSADYAKDVVPTKPVGVTSCDASISLVGWTTSTYAKSDDAPTPLYTEDVPAVTDNADYYAVWGVSSADSEESITEGVDGGGIISESGWTNSGAGSYAASNHGLKFDTQGDYITSPSIASENLKSVIVQFKAGYNSQQNAGSIFTIYAYDSDDHVLDSKTCQPATDYDDQNDYSYTLTSSSTIAYVKIALTTKVANVGMEYAELFKVVAGTTTGYTTNCVGPVVVTDPEFDVATGTYYEVKTVKISNHDDDYLYFYTLDGSDPAADGNLDPTGASVAYDHTTGIEINESCTLKAIAYDVDGNHSEVVDAAYVINLPLTTMDAIYAKAEENNGAQKEVIITFNNWVVSGVKDATAYVTDGTKGFIIYTTATGNHGLAVNDKISGTVTCQLKLFSQAAEVVGLTKSDITTAGGSVTNDGVITPIAKTIASLGGVNTGAPVIISNVTYNSTSGTLVDEDVNAIKPYTTLYNYGSTFVNNKIYSVTGIYLQYSNTKEILPRKTEDIVLESKEQPTLKWYVSNTKETEIGATYTINEDDVFAPYFESNSDGAKTYNSTVGTVASIDPSTGALSIEGVGETVISCAVEADGDYLAGSKSFTLKVRPEGSGDATWVASTWATAESVASNTKMADKSPIAIDANLSMTWSKAEGSNDPIYHSDGEGRLYQKNTLTITASNSKQITRIEFHFKTGYAGTISADAGTFENGVWTGFAPSVTFTNGASASQARIQSIDIEYAQGTTTTLVIDDMIILDNASATDIVFSSNKPGAVVTYSDYDEGVINIAEGKVTPVAIGNTTVKASIAAEAPYSSVSITFNVRVKSSSETVENVVILSQFGEGWIAMKHDFTAVEVEKAADGTILDLACDEEDIIWVMTADGASAMFQQPSTNKYLAVGSSNALTLVDDPTTWTLSGDGYYYSVTGRTFLYQGTGAKYKNYSANNHGKSADGGYSEYATFVTPVFANRAEIRTAGIVSGVWGTICPKKEVKYPTGASFFEISYVEYHSGVPYKVFYDEIAEGASLEAGHPYLFQADEESTAIKGIAVGDDATVAINDHGFKGVLENETISVVTADVENYRYYIVYENQIRLCGEGQFLIRAERAYLDMADPNVEKQYKAPINGRRRVALTNNAPQVATGIDALNASDAPVKVLIDGQLFILRGEKMFDAKGQLVK